MGGSPKRIPIRFNPETHCVDGTIRELDGLGQSSYRNISWKVGEGRGRLGGLEAFQHGQVVVYTMIGGGMLGDFAMRQPADFYIDSRVGKLPYPKWQIEQAVKLLAAFAEGLGLDPRNLEKPYFGNWGVF